MPDHSDVDEKRFAFGYTITIENKSSVAARLLSRHWIITDADGQQQEVRGEGVVGEQPLIHAGKSYRYSSGAILTTPVGNMQGSYTFVSHAGEYFEAPIAPFRLAMPQLVN